MEDPDECYAVMLEARAGLTFAVPEAPAQEPQARNCVRQFRIRFSRMYHALSRSELTHRSIAL